MPQPAQDVSAETGVPGGQAAAPQRLSAETPVPDPHAAAPGDGSAEPRPTPGEVHSRDRLHTATLGGGCFWCLEAVYQELEGVASVHSGYAGGHVENPTYQQVCGKGTGHAEVVQVRFDPEVTSYRELLQVFFTIHDPTTPDRQGADIGPQYRSIILTQGPEQERVAREVIAELEETGAFDDPVVTEVEPLDRFWPAEQAHHDYYRRNQNQPYCRIVIDPKLTKFRKVFQQKRRQP